MRIPSATVVIIVGLLHATASAAPSSEDLYNDGQAAFDRADYKMAISRWKLAYRQSRLPLLLFNLGQAYQLAGDCPKALSAYERYLKLEPKSEQRAAADHFVAELSAQCGQPTSEQPVEQTEQSVEKISRTGHDMRVAGLVTGGAGVAMLATGLVFGQRAVSLGDEVTSDCKTACNWSIEKTKQSDGQRDATVGKVLDGVGAAAIATGIGLYIYGARDTEPAVTIQARSTGATVSWSTRW